jgi:hypothetical protein
VVKVQWAVPKRISGEVKPQTGPYDKIRNGIESARQEIGEDNEAE